MLSVKKESSKTARIIDWHGALLDPKIIRYASILVKLPSSEENGYPHSYIIIDHAIRKFSTKKAIWFFAYFLCEHGFPYPVVKCGENVVLTHAGEGYAEEHRESEFR